MSLTSYRAAPPRVGGGWSWVVVPGLEDLAATYSPASWDAVPWALGFFTAEFGMGSGGGTPPWPPGRPAQGDHNTLSGRPLVWAMRTPSRERDGSPSRFW